MLTIGPFSRIAGVSPKVLRTYDALGLFRPVWLERGSGYRYYSPAQLPEIRRILALRDLGIGLAEIAGLVGGGTDLREALARRRAELERERREVDRRLAALDIRVASDAADGGIGDVVVRPIAAELVATIRIDPRAEMIELAFNELEAHVRDRGRRARRPPGIVEIGPDRDRRLRAAHPARPGDGLDRVSAAARDPGGDDHRPRRLRPARGWPDGARRLGRGGRTAPRRAAPDRLPPVRGGARSAHSARLRRSSTRPTT